MKKSNYSFMVVEDDLHANESIVNRMEKYENWKCISSETSLKKALEHIENKKPDLLFLDWEVIGGNTFSLLDKIQTLENYNPYIIYFTGYQNDRPEIPMEIINKYKVNRYLIKPIFENLTENLNLYISEAEAFAKNNLKSELFWITTIDKQKIKINPETIICISQSETNSRNKIIRFQNGTLFEIKSSWELCEKLANQFKIDYFFANARYTLINKKYISKIQKPYIWLDNKIKVEVTKDRWKEI